MQSKNMHLERVKIEAVEEVIEMVRKSARHGVKSWKHGANADDLRAVNEFLLRPAVEIIRQLKSVGASRVEEARPAEGGAR